VIIVIVVIVMIEFWQAFNLLTLTNVIFSLLNVLNRTMLILKAFFTQNGPVQRKKIYHLYFLNPLEATTLNPHLQISLNVFHHLFDVF